MSGIFIKIFGGIFGITIGSYFTKNIYKYLYKDNKFIEDYKQYQFINTLKKDENFIQYDDSLNINIECSEEKSSITLNEINDSDSDIYDYYIVVAR
jgi:hypothetical protein